MSENVGNILKKVAVVFMALDVIGGIIAWAIMGGIVGFLAFFATVIVSGMSCLMLYGFGQLIEDTGVIRRKLTGETSAASAKKDELPDL